MLGVGNLTADFTAASPQRPTLIDSDREATNPQLADLNHDGKLDIIVGVHETGNFGGTDYFEVLQGIGGGKFILVGQYEVSSSGYAGNPVGVSRLADTDGDAQLDLVFLDTLGSSSVSWLKGAGNGQFWPQATLLTVGIDSADVDAIDAVDLDGDGDGDGNGNGNGNGKVDY